MILSEENGLRILRPSIGYVLYRKGDENNFAYLFYLGKNDSVDNFGEIPEKEYEKIKAEEELSKLENTEE